MVKRAAEYIDNNTKDWVYVVKDFVVKLFGQALIPLFMDLIRKNMYSQAVSNLNAMQ